MKTKIIYTNNEEQEVKPLDGRFFTLKEMQEIVGGYVQFVQCNDENYICVIDEEGKIKDLYINEKARALVDNNLASDDYIVGNVLITHKKYIQ